MRTTSFSGERLRKLRSDRHLTQHDLASALRLRGFGTTQTTISRWEDGQHPNSAVLPSLATELGVAIEALYGDADEEESSMSFGAAMQSLFDRAVAKAVADMQRVPA